jgi:hypothetical protein
MARNGNAITRPVAITDGSNGTYTLNLVPADFAALRLFSDGQREIIHNERQYQRLKKIGLVTHAFTKDAWPKALAVLTEQGRQALQQAP